MEEATRTIEKEIILGHLTLNVGGDGLWSNTKQKLQVVLRASYIEEPDDEESWNKTDLFAFFSIADWNIREEGLVYTDKTFVAELNKALEDRGYPKAYYSEQGMQGFDYIHFDWEMSARLKSEMEL
jgi:hypothetical protein